MHYLIEIATTDFTSTEAAVKGGADRIELCTALSEGGLTPSFGLIKRCREKFDLPIFPIIRPRSGDFLYTDDEYRVIKNEIALCKELGCDGIVIGLLKEDGRIDTKKLGRIVEAAYPLEVTFHRAFDRCIDPFNAMEEIIEAGCQRILTSGQRATAMEGVELIKQLVLTADGRIIIMPGSGVKKENIKAIVAATGAEEFHAALRTTVGSKMEFKHPSFMDNDKHPGLLEEDVRKIKQLLHE